MLGKDGYTPRYFGKGGFFRPSKEGSGGLQRQRYKSQQHYKEPGIGVGIFLADILTNRILLGKRKDSGLYGLPGGWLETYEEWEECASRELKEEINLDLKKSRFYHMETFNCRHLEANYHAVSLVMFSEIEENEKSDIKNMEPNKCEKWFWISINQMREQLSNSLFYPLRDFLLKHPKMNSVEYLKKMARIPMSMPDKSEKKKKKNSMSSTLTNSPFYSSIQEEESILTKEDLLMI
mmetsp:Transcript_11049/g.11432  ORF Transcript_11049/g.11432 Transcript_11049/m.11432 type:complete len:236 (+) Transcript_11049:15-722(+)